VNHRRLNIGIRSAAERSNALRQAVRRVSRNRRPQAPELYFENVDELRRILTEKRMELVMVIGRDRPASIQELATLVARDYKNVSTDIALLERLGLVLLSSGRGKGKPQTPRVPYDEICVTIDLRPHSEPRARHRRSA
jgi:predicted transcriptional regulator